MIPQVPGRPTPSKVETRMHFLGLDVARVSRLGPVNRRRQPDIHSVIERKRKGSKRSERHIPIPRKNLGDKPLAFAKAASKLLPSDASFIEQPRDLLRGLKDEGLLSHQATKLLIPVLVDLPHLIFSPLRLDIRPGASLLGPRPCRHVCLGRSSCRSRSQSRRRGHR